MTTCRANPFSPALRARAYLTGQRLSDLAADVLARRVRDTFIELTDTMVTDFGIIEFLERLAARSPNCSA